MEAFVSRVPKDSRTEATAGIIPILARSDGPDGLKRIGPRHSVADVYTSRHVTHVDVEALQGPLLTWLPADRLKTPPTKTNNSKTKLKKKKKKKKEKRKRKRKKIEKRKRREEKNLYYIHTCFFSFVRS